MALPKKGVAYDFSLSLVSVAVSTQFQVNPTIAAGDFKISKDYGAFVNLAILPVVLPAGTINVKVSLSATEMQADKIVVLARDAAGAEWREAVTSFDVPLFNATDAVELQINNALTTLDPVGFQAGSRKVTIFEKDSVTVVKHEIVLSPNGLTRTRIT